MARTRPWNGMVRLAPLLVRSSHSERFIEWQAGFIHLPLNGEISKRPVLPNIASSVGGCGF